jgi:DUF4097 and DUF4098 domain-containing protein YvlB
MQQIRDTLLVGGITFLLVLLILIARPFYTPVEVSEEAQALTSGDTTIEEAIASGVVTIEDEEATEQATEAEATEQATEAEATEQATEAEATEQATEAEATEQATEQAVQADPTATFAPLDLSEPSANDPTLSQ